MATVISVIDGVFPANDDTGVPLKSTIYVLFKTSMNETLLEQEFFVEGPDTDTYVGPGISLLEYPDTVSEGDEFLQSPGFKGFVQGTYSFVKVDPADASVEVDGSSPYRTKMIFTPSHSLAPLTLYTAHLPEVTDTSLNLYTGHVTFAFTTGTGSIQEVPSTTSTSVLSSISNNTTLSQFEEFKLVSTTPADRSIKVDVGLSQIVIEFNKEIDEDSVDGKIHVQALPVTDHPNLSITANGDLATSVTVEGKKVIVRI